MADSKSVLKGLSQELVAAVQTGGKSVVRIDDGTRLTASGSVWSKDGLVVATSHGVERDEDLAVELADGSRHEAKMVGRDPESDIALLKVDHELPAFERGSDAGVGSFVLALGRPGRAGLQATFGIVGSISGRKNGEGPGLIYPDATLYPGFSGGALVDTDGRFVGLLNLSYGRGRGIAVSADVVQEVAEALLAHGTVRRGYLGIATQQVGITAAIQGQIGKAQESGLLVISIEADSAADKAGLLIGDTILSFDGQNTSDPSELRHALRSLRAGASVNLAIVRGGRLQEVAATLGERE